MLVDFCQGHPRREAEVGLDKARITVNKNTIPFDSTRPQSQRIRWEPAVTPRIWRGEMREVAALIAETLTIRRR